MAVCGLGPLDRGLLHVHQGRTDVYTQANGLSGDFVTRLFEDREGNIWVATKNGLDRFRDLAVRTISTNQGLPSAAPWSVLAARDGSVWLGALDGLSRWNARTGHDLPHAEQRLGKSERREAGSGEAREIFDSGLPDDGVGTLFEDGDGRLWVSTLRGVAYLENGRFIPRSPTARRTDIFDRRGWGGRSLDCQRGSRSLPVAWRDSGRTDSVGHPETGNPGDGSGS